MAYDFDTTNRYQGNSTPVTAYPFTLAAWFNADVLTGGKTILCLGTSGGATAQQRIYASPTAVHAESEAAATTSTAASTAAPSLTTWHHACGVFESDTDRRAFLDGGNKGTDATSRGWATFINRTVIGQRLRNGNYGLGMDGRIAETAVWNISLTDDEVLALGRGIRPSLIRPQNLVFYAPLIREVIDLRAARALTATNAPAQSDHTRRIA